ncbi:methyltransferase domain-containing protein [Streptomyces sp. NPDC056944]|uniref:class I SAM-dependent DNA methyltransferase n=1 Tax=Streptomyces sp. NPDC056944 TaxID=3345972 RepID=UPI003631C6F6
MTSSELWTRATADRYDAEETEMSSAAVLGPTLTFLAELAEDGRALEFAIGTGRVGVPLRERGVPVTGIELSEHMAAVLRRKVDADALPVTIGDMATTVVPGEFSLVYLVYNTITNLLTQDEQVECFRNAARHLAPGGRFVIELGVPPLRFLPPGQVAVPFDVSERHLGFDTFDLVEQILVSHHFTSDGLTSDSSTNGSCTSASATNDSAGGRYRRDSSRHRYAWPAELDLMARIAGLELERRVADWDGTPFVQDSSKHISVWRKPA